VKAVAYIRTSTEEQSTNNQLPVIKDWIDSKGYELVEIIPSRNLPDVAVIRLLSGYLLICSLVTLSLREISHKETFELLNIVS